MSNFLMKSLRASFLYKTILNSILFFRSDILLRQKTVMKLGSDFCIFLATNYLQFNSKPCKAQHQTKPINVSRLLSLVGFCNKIFVAQTLISCENPSRLSFKHFKLKNKLSAMFFEGSLCLMIF